MPKWRNRQTRYVQGVVGVTSWEFKSPLRHRQGYRRRQLRRFPCQWGQGHTGILILITHGVVAPFRIEMCEIAGAWSLTRRVRGKSGLRRARVPGENQGGAFRRVDSPDWHSPVASESNRDQAARRCGVKRAILPAAISESAVCRWLAKAGGREPSRRRRRDQSSGLREMTIQNRTRLIPTF